MADTGIPDAPDTDLGMEVTPWSEAGLYSGSGANNTNPVPPLPAPYSAEPGPGQFNDPTWVQNHVVAAFQNYHGRNPTDEELAFYLREVLVPGEDSRHVKRVGWNPYWEDRLKRLSYVGDPSLAGDIGILGYGYEDAGPTNETAGGMTPTRAAAPTSSDPAFDAAIKAMILKLLQGGSSDPYADPVNKGAQDAYNAQETRNADTMRNAIGERAAAEGTYGTGGYTNQLLGAEQTAGENKANFAATLATRTLERQRSELMSALSLGAGVMSAEQQRALMARIAEIDAAIRQQSVTNQNNQFNQNLGWEQAIWEALINQTPFKQ
jgi:hypothetical protein